MAATPRRPKPTTKPRVRARAAAPKATPVKRPPNLSPAAGLPQAVRSLRTVTEALQYAHQSFADAQLRQPRPEDYEPLTGPLREFAKIAPALVEVLRGVVSSSVPQEALRRVETAREAVLEALRDLPEESDYAPVAAQLRELASVSPSLMEWLREVPRLAAPLRGSVQALRRAVEELEATRTLLTPR